MVYKKPIKTVFHRTPARIIVGDPKKGSTAYYLEMTRTCDNCHSRLEVGDVVVEDMILVCLRCAVALHCKPGWSKRQDFEGDQLHWFLSFCHENIDFDKDLGQHSH